VDLLTLRAHCLAKAGTTAEHPFGPGALVMKVAGKVFAIIAEDAQPPSVSLKCEPEVVTALQATYDAVGPGYHLDKRHWVTVVLDGSIATDEVSGWVDDSYDLVVDGLPRRIRDRLRADPSTT
jgi:predicted DNA-binding protein (MmcQ/YjbR family)